MSARRGEIVEGAVRFLAGWPLALGLAGYILYATIDWEVPQPGAIRFGPLWVTTTVVLLLGWRVSGRQINGIVAMALGSVGAMLLTDVAYTASQNLRDLHLYIRAGQHFLNGEQVYLDHLLTTRPTDLSMFPFLYPPLTLPFFAVLALLPQVLADVGWLILSIVAGAGALVIFGVRRWWVAVLLLWPPLFQGIQVGNVAVLLALLFALAPWLGAGLVVAAVFKLYSGLAALWLIRERRVIQLVIGVAIVLGAALLTFPLTGLDRWREWFAGLDWYRASQPLLPGSLYGFGLPRYVPLPVVVAIGAGVVLAALRARGREGLARMGLATVVASPSLYAHGLIVALPSFLLLDARWLWLALGITSVAPGLGWWAAIALSIAGWFVRRLRSDGSKPVNDQEHELHPLAADRLTWPRLRTRLPNER